jgi:hypothetical protein
MPVTHLLFLLPLRRQIRASQYLVGLLGRGELLPRGEIFQDEVAAGTQEPCNEHKKKVQRTEDGSIFKSENIVRHGRLNCLIQQ